MSEITKLYENVGVKQERMCEWICKDSDLCSPDCQHYGSTQLHYPPFTAEKLIKLEMFLINKGDFDIKKGSVDITFESFTSCIAGLINTLWQSLTSEEKQQVKGILE